MPQYAGSRLGAALRRSGNADQSEPDPLNKYATDCDCGHSFEAIPDTDPKKSPLGGICSCPVALPG